MPNCNTREPRLCAILLAAACLLFLSGCRNVLAPPETAASGTGTLSLSILRQGLERTIVPEIDVGDFFVEFHLEFTYVSGGYYNEDFSARWTEASGTIDLDEGVWDLHVSAYTAGAGEELLVAAVGSLYGIDIPSGETLAGNVELFPIAGGSGTFSWDIGFPASVIDASMGITRLDDGDPFSQTLHLVFGGVRVPDNNPSSLTLASGQYRVVFTLSHPVWETVAISEILHVYQNMDSNFTETFTYEHFAVTLLEIVLSAWDGYEWDFGYRGIEAGHFAALGIYGIDGGNFEDIARWFGYLSVLFDPLADLDGLKALTDAALIGIASEDLGFLAYSYADRAYAEAAIAGLVANGTIALTFDWLDNYRVLVDLGVYGSMEFVFGNAIPLPLLIGTVSITGRPVIGLTLMANTDGLGGTGNISFQWLRDGDPIDGATAGTYTVQPEDEGYALTVRVSRDGFTGYVYSDPTEYVGYVQGPADTGLAAQFAWLFENAQSGGTYIIELSGDEAIGPQALPAGRGDLTIILVGNEPSTISLSSNGSLFTVGSGLTLVLDDNVTLQGREGNNNHLVRVENGGTLIMNDGSRVTGNNNTNSGSAATDGGGVRVNSGGTVVMYGGTIDGNGCNWLGGGVEISSAGIFDMHGGEIFGNRASSNGGGIRNAGTFRISNGIIFGNELTVETELRNTASSGAALSNSGTAQHGTFDDAGVFTSLGTLSTTNNTINVADGVLATPPIPPMEGNLAAQLTWLQTWAQDGGEYIIELNADETIAPQTLPTGMTNLTITLRGIGEMRNVNLSAAGILFTVGSGITLVLDENVTLMGRGPNAIPVTAANTNHLVRINSGGTLIMNEGSRIAGNENTTTTSFNGGGGVRVNNGGVFILNGGEISGNSATAGTGWAGTPSNGGGVFVDNGGRFDMRGGTISDNAGQVGGGVFVAQGNWTVTGASAGTFRIGDGIVHGNNAAVGLRNTSRTAGSASLGNSGTVQRGIFNHAGEFLPLGTLDGNDNFTIEIVDGVFRNVTLTFNANSGVGTAPAPQTVRRGFGITLPGGSGISRYGYFFAGWNTNAAGTGDGISGGMVFTPTDDLTLYAMWMDLGDSNVPGATFTDQLSWLQANAETGGRYHIVLTGDVSQAPYSLTFSGRSDIIVTLIGGPAMRTLSLSSNGSMFTVGSGVTLVLEDNVTLEGRSGNNTAVVQVNSGGALVMNAGSRVTGNLNLSTANDGGGVRINGGGIFTMYGGEIFGNFSGWNGGGVNISHDGTFTMHNGLIADNNVSGWGGGVLNFGTFNMHGGEIRGNTASNGGGGVLTDSGTFRISNGVIFGNELTVAVEFRNTTSGTGAALHTTWGTSQRGTFNDAGVFTVLGTFGNTNTTINVANGVLQ